MIKLHRLHQKEKLFVNNADIQIALLQLQGIAKMLSFHIMQKVNGFKIDYSSYPNKDGIHDKALHVEDLDKVCRHFIPDGRGLYFLDYSQDFRTGRANVVIGSRDVSK